VVASQPRANHGQHELRLLGSYVDTRQRRRVRRHPVHRTEQPLGERLHRIVQWQAARRAPKRRALLHAQGGAGPDRTVARRVQPPRSAQLTRRASAGAGDARLAGRLTCRLQPAGTHTATGSRTVIGSGATNGVRSAVAAELRQARRSGQRPSDAVPAASCLRPSDTVKKRSVTRKLGVHGLAISLVMGSAIDQARRGAGRACRTQEARRTREEPR